MLFHGLVISILISHLAFILFVVLGGLLVFRWQKMALIHIPAFIWGALIEFAGWICPLTLLEMKLRSLGGMATYQGGFIEKYLLSIIYPKALTHNIQILLGLFVLALNATLYSIWLLRSKKNKPDKATTTQNHLS